ncbi:heat shock protein Hsp20 domain-containing protein [Dictyostelium discoideum AX4]|uniref:Small heat shock protein hspF n=1 Tax=Dictyostelium discoideum TaxID=44689 RepID=HSPF_DICDI|nr:heat shock protein Hsp20 domain-containing protein [Dictyostelium discoideum AX4]XP_644663.2 heat shock protein Hsp20 domain-containing protein [Dictyostelium discoideum AX4]Q1ZXL6.1 RecName: Full=Small heat shock protein hspF [Dictyostelium discoideum]EAL70735.2 heat shock protein Hsp20 domain-containing protein [Dictyostelium discoideum AX4]EAS66921.1 heat shock protein Hsp20 domain-containing protein [Dictyostelium discoideum AX4]|eukprot:XP_001134605.1 heat shock protein Hsp20 domain-containing protein [Dictyostelium discoideum AX4]
MTEVTYQIQDQIKQFNNFNPIQKTNYKYQYNSDNENSSLVYLIKNPKQNNFKNYNNKICNYKRSLSSSSFQGNEEKETRKKNKAQFYENDFENGFGNISSWLNNSIPYKCEDCNGNNEPPHQKLKSQDIPLFTFFEPLTFIHEINKVIHIELEIAGVDKDDVKVDLTNNILTIVAKKKSVYPLFQNMCEFKRHEKSIGVYKRVLEFNSNTVDKDTIKARYVNGILLITVNKFL